MRSMRGLDSPEQKPPGFLKTVVLGKALPLALLAGLAYGAASWVLADVGGEYTGGSHDLGQVRLNLDKDGKKFSGTLKCNSTNFQIIGGTVSGGNNIELLLNTEKSQTGSNEDVFKAAGNGPTLQGKVDSNEIVCTFTDGKNSFPLTLHRNASSVWFKKLWFRF